jgi:hypothetical protein
MADLPPMDRLVSTRESWHRVTEHVLAAALKRATGQFALLPVPGGVGTPALPDGTLISVRGVELMVERDGDLRGTPLTTVREAAAFAGTEPGYPWTKQPPATPYEPDAPLVLDEASAALLGDWFALGDLTLIRWAAEAEDEQLPAAQIFPEHFDLGVASQVAEVNYGFSPGDSAIEVPYVYVGPWTPPEQDEFWNASFGAYRTIESVSSADEALDFLRRARASLAQRNSA